MRLENWLWWHQKIIWADKMCYGKWRCSWAQELQLNGWPWCSCAHQPAGAGPGCSWGKSQSPGPGCCIAQARAEAGLQPRQYDRILLTWQSKIHYLGRKMLVALKQMMGSNRGVSYRAYTDVFLHAENFCDWRRQDQFPRAQNMTRCEFNEVK